MYKKIVIISVSISVIFFVLGFLSSSFKLRGFSFDEELKKSYDMGWEEAKLRFGKVCVLPVISQENLEIKAFYGEIKEIKNGEIVIKANPIAFSNEKEVIKNVFIKSDTKIQKLIQKNEAEYNLEIEAYSKKINLQSPEPAVIPPARFIKQDIDVSSLKVGQKITVSAKEDVKNIDRVTALEILLDLEN